MSDDHNKEDQIITVQLPLKDYKTMRELIEERQAVDGLRKIAAKIFWFAGGILSLVGVIEVFRRFS